MNKLIGAIALVLVLVGCPSTEKQQADVIDEGAQLLEDHSHPELPSWESSRQTFLEDAKPYRPKPKASPSPTPSPTAPGGAK